MTTREMSLVAPNGQIIFGLKLNCGGTSPFTCTYDDANRTFLYTLPAGTTSKVLKRDGTSVLVDAEGIEWSASDVEYYSVGRA